MLQTRTGRLFLALAVLAALLMVARNLYRRSLNSSLVQAVETEDAPAVRSLLERGADPNTPRAPIGDQKVGDPLLPRVIKFMVDPPSPEQAEIACLLIRHGANLHNRPEEQNYLSQACSMGSPEVLRQLLEHDKAAISHFTDTHQRSPIQNAIEYGRYGWNLTEAQQQERRRISREMAALLLAHGARCNLAQAVELEDIERAEALLKNGAGADQEDENHITPLSLAAKQGSLNIMRMLLAHGADANHKADASGLTPLGHAVSAGKLEAARLLLDRDAQVHPAVVYSTPLDNAIAGKNPALVRLLLAHRADPNFHSRNNPVSYSLSSAIYNLPEVVPDLLRHGANINPVGGGPLVAAVSSGRAELTRDLLARGADVNAGNGQPLMAALDQHQPELAQELLRRGAKVRFPPEMRPTSTLSMPQPYPYTPMIAATLHAPECLEALLKAGAEINIADEQGQTPLTQAIVHAPKQVPWLLAHGADVHVVTRAGYTPLYLATEQDNLECIRLLLAHGAAVNTHRPPMHTALYRARKHNQTAAAELLAQAGGREE